MAMTMNHVFGLPWGHLKACNDAPSGAPRPYDAPLDTTRLVELGVRHRTTFEQGIKESLEKFVKNN